MKHLRVIVPLIGVPYHLSGAIPLVSTVSPDGTGREDALLVNQVFPSIDPFPSQIQC